MARNISILSHVAALATALWGTSALATPALAAPPSGLADWVARDTDLTAAQIAVVAPDNVYSLEPLGAPLPTGEVIALVRTEPRDAGWGAAHGFQSWDANLLIDCRGARLKVIRSATYPERNRKGKPTAQPADGDWMTPKPTEPAAQLLAAACDAGFVWPLRPKLASAASREPPAPAATRAGRLPVVVAADASPDPAQDARPAPTPPAQPGAASGQYAIQIVYGPSETDARKMLADARTTLGPMAAGLTEVMQTSEVGRNKRERHTGYLSGFADASAAQQACAALIKAKQDCAVRPAPPEAASPVAPSSEAPPSVAASAPATEMHAAAYFVQIARGPSAEGAKKALEKARKTLGPAAEGLSDATDEAQLGRRRRYTARLTGFPTASAASEACSKLARAGQTCFAGSDATP